MPKISERIWCSTLKLIFPGNKLWHPKITDLSSSPAFRTSLSRVKLHREGGRDGLKALNQAAGPFPVRGCDFMENTLRDKDLYIYYRNRFLYSCGLQQKTRTHYWFPTSCRFSKQLSGKNSVPCGICRHCWIIPRNFKQNYTSLSIGIFWRQRFISPPFRMVVIFVQGDILHLSFHLVG